MKKKNNGKIYFICDRTACYPCNLYCKYTSNITHVKNFKARFNNALADMGNKGDNVLKDGFFEERTDK